MYALHPVTSDYADFTEPEIAAFRESLRNHGLMVPIIIWHNQIVDGRHRARLCEELGIELCVADITQQYPTEEKMIAYVRVLNEHRRANTKPLTTAQKRARIDARLRKTPEKSNRQIAEELGVDHKTVGAARDELEATGEIPQLERKTGADGKSRKQPSLKAKSPVPSQKCQAVEPPDDGGQVEMFAGAAPAPAPNVDEKSSLTPAQPSLQSKPASSLAPASAPPADPCAGLVSINDKSTAAEVTPKFEAVTIAPPDEPVSQPNPMTAKALWVWGRLGDFERLGLLDKDPREVFSTLGSPMLDDVHVLAPKVAAWLKQIGKMS